MNKHLKILMLIFIYLTCNNIMAWSYAGHETISEIAYQDLSADKQEALDDLLDKLITALPPESKTVFKNQPCGLSKLARLSIMPDYWKRMQFDEVTEKLKIQDSNLINNLDGIDTANWHYTDKLVGFTNSKYIQTEDKSSNGKLDFAVTQLISNLENVDEAKARALGIVYIAHLLGDAHQPLHAASKGDKGGNQFCLIYKPQNNKCSYNLHQYWDSAGKYIDNNSKNDILTIIEDLDTELPKSMYTDRIYKTTPKMWLDDSFKYWPIVYSAKQNQYPNKSYETKTRKITKDQIKLAAYRLSNFIDSVLMH